MNPRRVVALRHPELIRLFVVAFVASTLGGCVGEVTRSPDAHEPQDEPASADAGACSSSRDCDDGDPCTADRCHVDAGTCVHAPTCEAG